MLRQEQPGRSRDQPIRCAQSQTVERCGISPGSTFSIDRLRHLIGLFVAGFIGAFVSVSWYTASYKLFFNSAAPALTLWHDWFMGIIVGIIIIAPFVIGLSAILWQQPPRSEVLEGVIALLTLGAVTAIIVSMPKELWETQFTTQQLRRRTRRAVLRHLLHNERFEQILDPIGDHPLARLAFLGGQIASLKLGCEDFLGGHPRLVKGDAAIGTYRVLSQS
jgi:hypothetical protein